jgi:hypothetical protein
MGRYQTGYFRSRANTCSECTGEMHIISLILTKRLPITSKSPERVNIFPPFGGLCFVTRYPNITSLKQFNSFAI